MNLMKSLPITPAPRVPRGPIWPLRPAIPSKCYTDLLLTCCDPKRVLHLPAVEVDPSFETMLPESAVAISKETSASFMELMMEARTVTKSYKALTSTVDESGSYATDYNNRRRHQSPLLNHSLCPVHIWGCIKAESFEIEWWPQIRYGKHRRTRPELGDPIFSRPCSIRGWDAQPCSPKSCSRHNYQVSTV